MSRRVAFVHFPHWPEQARIETMPFAMQSVRSLAEAGWDVDVFLLQRERAALTDNGGGRIRYRMPGRLVRSLPKLAKPLLHALRYGLLRNYACIFGLGQIGLSIASEIASIARCPLVYLNDELPSGCPNTIWTRKERSAARRVDFVLSPDLRRNPLLLHELDLPADTPNGVLYNRPVIVEQLPQIDWHAKLGIPNGKHIVLHAGSVADWAQVPELLATVPTWPEDVVLLLHSRSSGVTARYQRSLSHLQVDGRVYWSNEPLVESELHSLIAAATACLGLYRNSCTNIEQVGYSSGKILRSLVCGTPVIASALSSLDFVTNKRLGAQVQHPLEIADCLQKLIADRKGLRERCLDFSDREISFDSAWLAFTQEFATVSGIDLQQPTITGAG